MPESDELARRKADYSAFSDKYALPANWRAAIERSLEVDNPSKLPFAFEFDFKEYLEDDRYIHILTLDECCGAAPEGGEDFFVFAIWLVKGTPLNQCPVVASMWTHNDDESCSSQYTQEVSAKNIDEFLRQLATGVAGRDQSTWRPNLIDATFFKGLAEPFASVSEALSTIEANAEMFSDVPAPRRWGL